MDARSNQGRKTAATDAAPRQKMTPVFSIQEYWVNHMLGNQLQCDAAEFELEEEWIMRSCDILDMVVICESLRNLCTSEVHCTVIKVVSGNLCFISDQEFLFVFFI